MNHHPSPRDRATAVIRTKVELLAYRIASESAAALDKDGLLFDAKEAVHLEGRAIRAEAEVKRLRAHRLVMAVFGVPEDAPQPFALLGDDNKPFALGVQWPGGTVTIKSTPPERLGNVTSPSLDDYFTQYGASPVVWLSEDLGTLADYEDRAIRAEAKVARALEHLRTPRPQYDNYDRLVDDLARILEG